jgi:hypothetical protein
MRFQIGDKVRIVSKPGMPFAKGTAPKYRKMVYEIARKEGYSFVLKNPVTGKTLKNRFKYYDLQKISGPVGIAPARPESSEAREVKEPSAKEILKDNRQKRRLKEANIDSRHILSKIRERRPKNHGDSFVLLD